MSFNLVGLGFNSNEAEFLDVECYQICTYHNLGLDDPNIINYIENLDGHTTVVINSNPEHHGYIELGLDMPKIDLASKIYDMDDANVIFLIDSDCNGQDRFFMTAYCGCTYLTQPVTYLEVVEEARKLSNNLQETIIIDNNFKINLITREIFYDKTRLKPGPKLFDLIVYFVTHPSKLITREELLSKVFDINEYLDDRSIDTNIKKVRQITNYDILETVRGKGYIYHNNRK